MCLEERKEISEEHQTSVIEKGHPSLTIPGESDKWEVKLHTRPGAQHKP